jgi:tRNA-dependent cyclodipeptide synthase
MISLSVKGNKKKIFSNTIAVLGISLHNPNHNGDKFHHIIDWVNEYKNFTKCYIDLSDTLYRHNYMLTDANITEKQAFIKALNNGDKWLERHKTIIDNLKIPYNVMRWNMLLNRPDFSLLFDLYKESYKTHAPFKNCVDLDIQTFFSRKGVNTSHILPKEKFHALNFLLEELACHTLLYKDIAAANIYPGKMPYCYKFVKENGLPNIKSPLNGMTYTRLVYHGIEIEEKSDLLKEANNNKQAA